MRVLLDEMLDRRLPEGVDRSSSGSFAQSSTLRALLTVASNNMISSR